MTPSHAYYHYTTARYNAVLYRAERVRSETRKLRKTRSYPDILMMFLFGPPGIEPGLYEPESYVLPVYYGPNKNIICESHYPTEDSISTQGVGASVYIFSALLTIYFKSVRLLHVHFYRKPPINATGGVLHRLLLSSFASQKSDGCARHSRLTLERPRPLPAGGRRAGSARCEKRAHQIHVRPTPPQYRQSSLGPTASLARPNRNAAHYRRDSCRLRPRVEHVARPFPCERDARHYP